MTEPVSNKNLVKATLAQVVNAVGRESQITMLGDTSHTNIEIAEAMMSPEVIRAAAKAGKKLMILEAADPSFEVGFNQYRDGKITIEQVREAFSKIGFLRTAAEDLPRYHAAWGNLFVALKNNGMQLGTTDRFASGQTATMTANPEFADLNNQITKAQKEGKFDALVAKLVNEKGEDHLRRYNELHKQHVAESNVLDANAIKTTLKRLGNPPALIVWGDGHNIGLNDLDELLGQGRVRTISIFGSEKKPQLLNDGLFREEMPQYVYYVREGSFGKPDARVITTTPGAFNTPSPGYGRSVLANSMVGLTIPIKLECASVDFCRVLTEGNSLQSIPPPPASKSPTTPR